jgi:hypothetical protein
LIGDFHFDSERSRVEQDFRLFIRPSDWPAIRDFCIEHFSREDDPVLETDPARELGEEFSDTLKITLKPEQYISKPVATVIENEAAPTENIHAKGLDTARVYRIFEAAIMDSSIKTGMLTNSKKLSDQDLRELALADAQKGGRCRANAILTLPLKRISAVYLAMSPAERNTPIWFEEHQLDETVLAVLEDIPVPKYQRS